MDNDTLRILISFYCLTSTIWNYVADGDLENAPFTVPQGKSSGTVLPYVGVACLGAILFGYHLGYGSLILHSWEIEQQNIYASPASNWTFFFLSWNVLLCNISMFWGYNGFVLCFGCCRVVNGALEYLAKDLGIAENTVLQGKCSNFFFSFFFPVFRKLVCCYI